MPQGDKSAYTDKQKRKAEHIEEGYEDRGVSEKEAERRAWATVNKESGGGKKSGSGRDHAEDHASSEKGGRKGGAAAASRTKEERSVALTTTTNLLCPLWGSLQQRSIGHNVEVGSGGQQKKPGRNRTDLPHHCLFVLPVHPWSKVSSDDGNRERRIHSALQAMPM
ncbi:hypothetical protein LPU83_pLPU83d_0327 (plasmid) [Rhizobium favelukesii]|uniref:Plasmid stabilization protein n=1 Tax=Rhizobium favelukesii TaxID=348824 RepID=W6RSA0_9HYPH|nr:hypothetical protein LPU83_pLPU83d_0327 [Rhizobium favelukesii]